MLMLIASPFNEIHKVPLADPPEPPAAELERPQPTSPDPAERDGPLYFQVFADLVDRI